MVFVYIIVKIKKKVYAIILANLKTNFYLNNILVIVCLYYLNFFLT